MAANQMRPNAGLVFAKLVGALIVTGVLAAGMALPFVGGLGLAAKHGADKFLDTSCHLQETPPPQRTQVYASDNKTLIATIFTQDRQPVPLSQIPTYLQKALVDTEDRRFYSHHGVDIRGLIRSAVSNSSGGDTQGGSTLTMQYVKQIRYYQAGEDKKKQAEAIAQNIDRKMEDAQCALEFEKHESKSQILDNYLNIAFFGENSYGIQTAAQTYFGKDASQLTLPESATLVGLLRAPTQYDPFINPDQARQRRNDVLQNLVNVGDLSQAQADRYKQSPIQLASSKPPTVRQGCDNAPDTVTNVGFFCNYAMNWLEQTKTVTPSQLETGGLRIVTTLDAKLQNSMQAKLAKAIPAGSPMTAVLPVIDPHTGNILAMATSKKYGQPTNSKDTTHTSLPLFTSYTAQGASTYKLFPLLAALSTGFPTGWKLKTPTDGAPYSWSVCNTKTKVYNGDANEHYDLNETLSSATAKSSNTFYVGLADQGFGCTLQPIIDMATKLGMKSLSLPTSEPHTNVAQSITKYSDATQLVLGDIETSPLELTAAYAAVVNDGKYNAPAPVQSVTDVNGHAITVPREQGRQVVAPQVARQAVHILTGDTKTSDDGTSAEPFSKDWYNKNDSIVAGKTGTSVAVNPKTGKPTSQNSSVWFVGMTPDLVSTSALINFDHPNYASTGLPGVGAGKAYGEYASKVWLDVLAGDLSSQHWTWDSAGSVDGDQVPDVTGKSLEDATSTLKDAGYKLQQLDAADGLVCADAAAPLETIAYQAPTIAPKGSTITVCMSSGQGQDVYTPPPPPPPVSHSSHSSTSKTGSGHSSTPGGGHSTGGGNGGGGGGRSSGHNGGPVRH